MITFLNYTDLNALKDLEDLGNGEFSAIGEDPNLEIKNLPKGLIYDICIEILAEYGEMIEIYWTYEKNQPYSPSCRLSLKLIPGSLNKYRFIIDTEKEIKKLRLDPTDAKGIIKIKKIKLFHLSPAEKIKLRTIPNFKKIKKITLKGKRNFLFLINDSNHELRQHFDQLYHNNFQPNLFQKNLNFKEDYCFVHDIRYQFFLVPDKSLVCKDFLPFEVNTFKRNYDSIKNLVPDFIEKLDSNCYFKNDSHINYLGGKILSYYYLNYIDNNFNERAFSRLMEEQISTLNSMHNGDLTFEKNWSYLKEEKENYLNEKTVKYHNNFLEIKNDLIPEKFKFVGIRETKFYKNKHGFRNLKVLILGDSSFEFLKDFISSYFSEILVYWDHWFFNKELIEWYKPDVILEIRTERFLENMKYEFCNPISTMK